MTIQIEEEVEPGFDFDYRPIAEQVINYAIEKEQFPYEAEVSLTLVDNASIQEINRMHREIDRATDVLSFPLLQYREPADFSDIEQDIEDNFNPDTGEVMLGDIVISVDKVKEQANNYGHTQKREFAFLVAHSMLHLLGYDHMQPEEAEQMESRQRELLDELGITR